MADYYERKVYAAKELMPSIERIDALQKTINGFFNLRYLDDYIKSFDDFREDFTNNYDYQDLYKFQPALQLLNNNPKELEKFYTETSQFEIQLKRYNFWLVHNKEAAEKLIEEIQKEYHLPKGRL